MQNLNAQFYEKVECFYSFPMNVNRTLLSWYLVDYEKYGFFECVIFLSLYNS